jgi:hypothetical protein
VVFDNKMWVIGGFDGTDFKSDVWYSSDGITWAQATASAAFGKRAGHTSVVFPDPNDNNKLKMWVIGGSSAPQTTPPSEIDMPQNDVWSSSDGINWMLATSVAAFPARMQHTSVVFADRMWVIGGKEGSPANPEYLWDSWFSSDGVNWRQSTTSNYFHPTRAGHASVVYPKNDGGIWVIGGITKGDYQPTPFLGDVWTTKVPTPASTTTTVPPSSTTTTPGSSTTTIPGSSSSTTTTIPTGNFNISIPDSAGDVGAYSSIAVDSNNKAHICYYDRINRDLKYATNASGDWQTKIIDSSGDIGASNSIAVDNNNKVHISYYDKTLGNLKYATDNLGSWSIVTVDGIDSNANLDAGLFNSIAIDNQGYVHISYIDATKNRLKYAVNNGIITPSPWVKNIIETYPPGLKMQTAIAVDTQGKIHIVFESDNNKIITVYYYSDKLNYSQQSFGDNTSLPDIALDDSDKVYVCYRSSSGLVYQINTSGSWLGSPNLIDSSGNYGSICLDKNNKIHISYVISSADQLKYATNKSGSWAFLDVDSAFAENSIAVNPTLTSNVKAHISYYDFNNKDLKYAVEN